MSNSNNNTEYGVTPDGFRRKYLDEVFESLLRNARQRFPNKDLKEGSPHREMIDVPATEFAAQWEALEGVYQGQSLRGATGVQLDNNVAYAGVQRLPRRGATGEVTFSVSSGTTADSDITIPEGTTVATDATETMPAIPFRTTEVATIYSGESSVGQVPIRAVEPYEAGAPDVEHLGDDTNVAAGTITDIRDPIGGVPNVTNPLPTGTYGVREDGSAYEFVVGRDRETDTELRARYENSLALGGDATLRNIRDEVRNVTGVSSVGIEEVIDADTAGFRLTVVGGRDEDIAEAITSSRSAGIESLGSVQVASAESGTGYERFDRASQVQIYVEADISHDGTFPGDGVERITDALVKYLGGEDTQGITRDGTDVGEDVIYDSVFARVVDEDLGVWRADSLTIGTSDPPSSTSDIAISSTEIARTALENITINATEAEKP